MENFLCFTFCVENYNIFDNEGQILNSNMLSQFYLLNKFIPEKEVLDQNC